MHFSQEGKAICRLRVAVQGFKRDDPPTWFSVTAFGKDAEFVGQYLHKGDTVYVQGTGELRKAPAPSGVEKEYYGIAARSVQGVNAKAREGGAAGNGSADDRPVESRTSFCARKRIRSGEGEPAGRQDT